MDNFHWGEHNGVVNATSAYICSAILDYVNAEQSWVLGAAYKMDGPTSSISHASKTTPQYGFHQGIKEFGDDGRETTKQELYKNLLGMDEVTMIRPKDL